MKSKCIKYVFKPHPVSGRFCYRVLDGNYAFLDEKFPYLCKLGRSSSEHMYIEKINFTYFDCPGVAWIDKHGNAIVRYNNPFKQTKINF